MKKQPGPDKVAPTGVDLSTSRPSSSPQMPHERDQTVGSTDGHPSGDVQQAARDVARGLEDTSRAPEADRAYDKQKK